MLEGKVVLITGSTRGIGWETARLFAENGASLVLNGRDENNQLAERVAELRALGCEAIGVPGDVSDPTTVASIYQTIFKTYKRLDVLVNNAGILQDELLGMIPEQTVQDTFAVNTFAAIHNVQSAARIMTRNRSGSIIIVTSIIGVVGNEGQAVYGSSKAALIGLTKSAAKELAPKQVRVNAVAPGFIDTEMTRALPKETYDKRVASIKMKRIGQARDVANVILFLASPLADYVTGQVIGVDGGMLI